MLGRVGVRAAAAAPFLLVFNTFFFVLGESRHSSAVWISYAFVHLSYLVVLAAPFFVPRSQSSAVFGLTSGAIAATYFAIELVVGSIFIIAAPENYEAALLTQLLLFGIFVVFSVWAAASNMRTRDTEEDSRIATDYLKKARSEVGLIVASIHDKESRRRVEGVYDAIASSPVKSDPSLSAIETRILVAVGALREVAGSGNWQEVTSQSDALLGMITERQRQLKLLN